MHVRKLHVLDVVRTSFETGIQITLLNKTFCVHLLCTKGLFLFCTEKQEGAEI